MGTRASEFNAQLWDQVRVRGAVASDSEPLDSGLGPRSDTTLRKKVTRALNSASSQPEQNCLESQRPPASTKNLHQDRSWRGHMRVDE